MRDLYFMKYDYIRSLAALCTLLLLSACDGLSDTTTSSGGEDLAAPVVLGSAGSVTVNWTAPTLRADDDTPLDMAEISGYRIYYGTKSGIYPNSVDIPDRTAQQFIVEDIPAGRYFFVMTTLDLEGRESAFSSPEIQIQV